MIAVTGLAVSLTAFHLSRHFFLSPDVYISKDNRKSTVRANHDDGASFYAHRVRRAALNNTPHIFGGLNAKNGHAFDRSHGGPVEDTMSQFKK